MRTKLILFLFIGVFSLANSQKIDKSRLQDYYLTNKLNDTTLIYVVYGEVSPIDRLHEGFKIYDEKGHYTDANIHPDYWNSLSFENSDGKITTLISLPLYHKISGYAGKNVFINTLIENSDKDLKKGKVDFYACEFYVKTSKPFGSEFPISQAESGYKTVRLFAQVYYFRDKNGYHQIKTKSDFKRFPEILGEKLYKKMKKSNKGKKQFLFDYFTKHNNSLSQMAAVK